MHKTTTARNIYEVLYNQTAPPNQPPLNEARYFRDTPLENRMTLPDSFKDGHPANSMPLDVRRCCDSRKDECPYHFEVVIETPEVKFRQYLCLYKYHRKYE